MAGSAGIMDPQRERAYMAQQFQKEQDARMAAQRAEDQRLVDAARAKASATPTAAPSNPVAGLLGAGGANYGGYAGPPLDAVNQASSKPANDSMSNAQASAQATALPPDPTKGFLGSAASSLRAGLSTRSLPGFASALAGLSKAY